MATEIRNVVTRAALSARKAVERSHGPEKLFIPPPGTSENKMEGQPGGPLGAGHPGTERQTVSLKWSRLEGFIERPPGAFPAVRVTGFFPQTRALNTSLSVCDQ
ncbi:hypothetical protein Bbelb_113100 [Branchiostoma belcheri]|nr:hypothetical protein Bbelb_113100 [Branchiostoma belcheri]